MARCLLRFAIVTFCFRLHGSIADSGETCAAGDVSPKCTGEQRKPKLRKCELSSGEEVVPATKTTIARAVKECKRLSGCGAVSAYVGDSFDQKQEYLFRYVTKGEPCETNPAYRTVVLPVVQDLQPAWPGPPSLEFLRAQPNVTIIQEDPPVVQFNNFLSDSEIEYIKRAAETRFVQSTTGMTYDSGNARTSETAWLNEKLFLKDKVLNAISERMTKLTAVPDTNMEPFQVVRYQAGQFFSDHQDYLDAQEYQECGGRVGTFFMYLNDVPSGGGTKFARWKFTVQPKKGMAILWWNVQYAALQNGDPKPGRDENAWHEALPVNEGEKWIVNRWLHPKDFMTPYHAGRLR